MLYVEVPGESRVTQTVTGTKSLRHTHHTIRTLSIITPFYCHYLDYAVRSHVDALLRQQKHVQRQRRNFLMGWKEAERPLCTLLILWLNSRRCDSVFIYFVLVGAVLIYAGGEALGFALIRTGHPGNGGFKMEFKIYRFLYAWIINFVSLGKRIFAFFYGN